MKGRIDTSSTENVEVEGASVVIAWELRRMTTMARRCQWKRRRNASEGMWEETLRGQREEASGCQRGPRCRGLLKSVCYSSGAVFAQQDPVSPSVWRFEQVAAGDMGWTRKDGTVDGVVFQAIEGKGQARGSFQGLPMFANVANPRRLLGPASARN